MHSKKILILTQGIDGGIARMSSFLACAMHKNGFDVTNCYLGRPANQECHFNDLSNGVNSLVYTTGKARSLDEVKGLIKSIYFAFRIIKKIEPDIIVFNGQIPLICYFFLGQKSKKIFYDHGPQFSFKRIKKVLNKIALRYIDKIISVASFSINSILKATKYNGETEVVTNCVVNEEEITNQRGFSNPNCLKVLMAARVDFVQKDPITLIKAVKLAHDRGVNIELHFAGSGPAEQQLLDSIELYSCSKYIIHLGHVELLKERLSQYNISCLSSHYESFGLSLVEGMAAGHLAIGSNVCGIDGVIKNGINGILFEEGSFESLAEVFENVYKNPKSYDRIVNKGIEDVRNLYTYEIYENLISKAVIGVLEANQGKNDSRQVS